MFKKMFYVIAILIFCAVAFSGYLHEQDINDLAYVIAVGFDVGSDEKLKLTFQVSIPSANGSGSSGGDGSSSSGKGVSDTLNETVECNSFNSGLNIANNIISKRLNLSHCKFIIFSEELASRGIHDYIYTLENNIELRSNCNILVSNSTAEEFINSSIPILEHSTSKYYEIITTASRYSGYTSDATLNTVYTSIIDDFSETSTMLGKVQKQKNSSEEGNSSEGESSDKEEDTLEGESSSSGQTSSEEGPTTDIVIDGIAVFKKDKLVGTLSREETIPYLIVTDKLNECIISIPSPFSENNFIDLHIYDFAKTKNSVKLDSSGPHITTDVTLKSTILSNDLDFDSSSKEDVDKIVSAASEYLNTAIMDFYEKTAKEFKSDVTGLGKYAVYMFPTIDDWKNYNWSDKYETSTFDVNVTVNIESSYFIS